MELFKLKDGRELIIREGRKEDAQAVLDYLEKVASESDFLTFGPGEHPFTQEEEEVFIERCAKADNQLFLIALVDGILVSCLTFRGNSRPRTRHTGEFGITVLRAFWGLGIATRMIEHMISWAKESGVVRKIDLRVRSDNHRAIGLYDKLGFAKEGLVTREFLIDGKFYDSLLMGLKID